MARGSVKRGLTERAFHMAQDELLAIYTAP